MTFFLAWTPRRNHKFGAEKFPVNGAFIGICMFFFLGGGGWLNKNQCEFSIFPVISLKFAYKIYKEISVPVDACGTCFFFFWLQAGFRQVAIGCQMFV